MALKGNGDTVLGEIWGTFTYIIRRKEYQYAGRKACPL